MATEPSLSRPRTRLLVLLPTLHGGGAERVMLTLLRHFDRNLFEPMLAVVDGRSADLSAELAPDVPCYELGCRRVSSAAPRLLRLLYRLQPQIVLSTVSHLNLMLAMLRPALPRTIRVIGRGSINLSEVIAAEGQSLLWRIAYKIFYRRLDLVVCQSQSMQQDLCLRFGVPESRTVVLPNPIDLDRVAASGAELPLDREPVPERRLVAAGRLAPQKGFDALLRALAACSHLPLHLDLLGQGPCEAKLRERVRELGLEGRVSFRGFTANPYPWLRQADALVLSSRYEGLPNVVLEALACGTPVIATPVPSVLEILRGLPHCEVADDFSVEALARALRNWYERPLARMPIGVMDSYSASSIARRYEEALLRSAFSREATAS